MSPSDHGSSIVRIDTAHPRVAICHMAALMIAAEGDERRTDAPVLLAPRSQREEEAEPFDPAAHDDQGEPG